MNKLPTFFARAGDECERAHRVASTQRAYASPHGGHHGDQPSPKVEMNARIAGESFEPGVSVSEVARRDVATEVGEVL